MKIKTTLQENEYYLTVFSNISEAFDRIWHDELIHKTSNQLLINICRILDSHLSGWAINVLQEEKKIKIPPDTDSGTYIQLISWQRFKLALLHLLIQLFCQLLFKIRQKSYIVLSTKWVNKHVIQRLCLINKNLKSVSRHLYAVTLHSWSYNPLIHRADYTNYIDVHLDS